VKFLPGDAMVLHLCQQQDNKDRAGISSGAILFKNY